MLMKSFWQEDEVSSVGMSANKRGGASLESLLAPANVSSAWQRVRRNRGCAGVDGISIAELEPVFQEEWPRIGRALQCGNYHPQPLLRVRIPKPSGGERLLGIPSVIDRVVQQSATQILTPSWEPRFSVRSYAYRPSRGPRNALASVERAINRGNEHVLHLDIENFFDSVPHSIVLGALEHDLTDDRMETLVRRTLNCGVYEHGVVRPTTIGLAQGSPLSPLLANVVLHHLDAELENAGWEFARYADDCVLLMSNLALVAKARDTVIQSLSGLGLKLNERKTAFSHFTQARFLGFGFRRDEHGRAVRTVSSEAKAEATESLCQFVKTAGNDAEIVAAGVAQMLRSWLAYFYAPHDEADLRRMVESIAKIWCERFSKPVAPECLRWESLCRSRHSGEHMDYSGHFQGANSFASSVDWTESMRCLLFRLLRSRWWHLEYDLELGRKPGLRLFLGKHRINLRF